MVATFLTTHLIAVLQSSGYFIFHGKRYSYSIQSFIMELSYQYLNTETPSIFYTIWLYI